MAIVIVLAALGLLGMRRANRLGPAPMPDNTGGPVNGVAFTVTPGGQPNSVVATIPAGEAAAGKHFGRLRADS